MLSFEYIQFLNDKVQEYLPPSAKKVGNKINMRCPICGDSRKSSFKKRGWWYSENASYYCFNCGTGMSGIKFLEFISGNDYDDIKKEYFKLAVKNRNCLSISRKKQENDIFNVKSIVKPEWKIPLSTEAKEYLKSRLVLDAPYYHNDLYSWFNNNKDEYILIDWVFNGIDAYYQLNDFKKHGQIKYIFPKDTKKLVAGLDNIDTSWPYIIVFEGFYDSLFVKNGVCVGTKAITEYQFNLMKKRFPHHQIVVSFDNDDAGIASMRKLIIENANVKFFKWFNRSIKQKDINDFVISKNDVNIFKDENKLESMIVDKLTMKLHLAQYDRKIKFAINDTSTSRKTRQIFKCGNW